MSKIRVRANVNLSWVRRGTEVEVEQSETIDGLIADGRLTDLSPVWVPQPADEPDPLEALTKPALVEMAESLGIDVKSSWTKAELIEEIENADSDDH